MLQQVSDIASGGCRMAASLDDWNQVVGGAFENLTVDADSDGFKGALEVRRIGALDVSRVASSPAVVRRARPTSLGKSVCRYFKLHIQDAGSSLNLQGGHEAVLRQGDLMLCDSAQPYSIRFDDPNRMLVLRLPEDKVIERFDDPEDMTGRRIGAEGLGASMLSAFVQSLWCAPEAGAAQDNDTAFLDVVIDLLAIAYGRRRQPADRAGPAHKARIKRFVDDNLCDPDLNVTGVAREVGVTPRYVQMVFASMGTTPLAYIRHQRLQLAAQRLLREGSSCSITDLSFSLGFNDLSHFSRSFKSHYGVGPREYRAR